MSIDQPALSSCPRCREPMQLVRAISYVGVPEILVFYCTPCKHAETKVQGRAA